jgi:hypothetical protein
MSFLDVPGVNPTGLDAAVAAKVTTPGTATAAALSATYAPVSGSANYTSPTQAAGISVAMSVVFGG